MKDNELLEKYPHGIKLWKEIAKISPKILVAFSRGKDSIAMAIELRKSNIFEEMIFFYKYRIPNIGFVQESIKYYENFFDTHIYQLPHPTLYKMLNDYTFQSPNNLQFIYDCDIPNFDHEFLVDEFKKDLNLSIETYSATGIRANDSLSRRMAIYKYGVINKKSHNFNPIWNYKKQQCFDIIKEAKCKLPPDYELFGRSFDGINYQFLLPIKDKYPDDYEKILDFFPLSRVEIDRINYYLQHKRKINDKKK